MFGSEDVGVEPNAGISSVPYQVVKAIDGPTIGTSSVLEKLVPLPQRVFVDHGPSEAFLFLRPTKSAAQQCFSFFSFHLPLQLNTLLPQD